MRERERARPGSRRIKPPPILPRLNSTRTFQSIQPPTTVTPASTTIASTYIPCTPSMKTTLAISLQPFPGVIRHHYFPMTSPKIYTLALMTYVMTNDGCTGP
ncbi:unnamed protein product [Allacma fusca]|uniref:Uncharacterized protein n=1 Tax=Allacma fusca TaxID=39272 RepID=A0A8J2K867_9HEXA|nr:unnamed protein product [Allacma fusca]